MNIVIQVMSMSVDEVEEYVPQLAQRFARDPQQSAAQGIRPDYGHQPSRDIGAASDERSKRSNYAAWLYGVAKHVLPNCADWKITELIGGGALFEVVNRRRQ